MARRKAASGLARGWKRRERGQVVHRWRTKRALTVILALSLLAWAGLAFAAEKGAMNETVAWPSGAGGWTGKGEAVRYRGRAIFDYIDGAGEVYLTYNFREVSVRRYERKDRAAIIAELYDMGTAQDAFGVFSWDRQDPEAGIGQGSEFGGGLLRFWKGRHFVSVYGEGEGKEQERAILEIGRGLASSIAGTGEPPRLIRSLPDEGRVEGSVRFVRSHVLLNQRCFISNENILRLGTDTEAVFARYDLGKERTFVIVVGYPTEAGARSALASFTKAYKLGADGMGEAGGAWTGAEAEGRHVIIALRAQDRAAARRLIDSGKMKLKEGP
jgi:hypothetical protein